MLERFIWDKWISEEEKENILCATPLISYTLSPDLDFSEFTLSSIFEISRSDTFCCHHQSHNPVTFVTGSVPRDSGGKYRKPSSAPFSIPFCSQPADGPDELVAPSQLFTMWRLPAPLRPTLEQAPTLPHRTITAKTGWDPVALGNQSDQSQVAKHYARCRGGRASMRSSTF